MPRSIKALVGRCRTLLGMILLAQDLFLELKATSVWIVNVS